MSRSNGAEVKQTNPLLGRVKIFKKNVIYLSQILSKFKVFLRRKVLKKAV